MKGHGSCSPTSTADTAYRLAPAAGATLALSRCALLALARASRRIAQRTKLSSRSSGGSTAPSRTGSRAHDAASLPRANSSAWNASGALLAQRRSAAFQR